MFLLSGEEQLTVIGGIAVCLPNGREPDTLLEQADRYRYTAKERGRCRRVYTVSRRDPCERYETTTWKRVAGSWGRQRRI